MKYFSFNLYKEAEGIKHGDTIPDWATKIDYKPAWYYDEYNMWIVTFTDWNGIRRNIQVSEKWLKERKF